MAKKKGGNDKKTNICLPEGTPIEDSSSNMSPSKRSMDSQKRLPRTGNQSVAELQGASGGVKIVGSLPHLREGLENLDDGINEASEQLMHINAVGVQDPHLSYVQERDFEPELVPPQVLEFSEVSNPDTIRQICHKSCPGWKDYSLDSVLIKQVTEGLTNQIFKVFLDRQPGSKAVSHEVVLFRIYGQEMSEFIDPEVELQTFKMLSQYEIAPKLIDQGKGWRIEEWHYALPVPVKLLKNPSIYCQVASQLGRFHKLHMRQDFPENLDRTPACIRWLDNWAKSAAKVAMKTKEWEWRLQSMLQEATWLSEYIQSNMQRGIISGQGWDVVFCHNDCQENNLLETQYGLRLIDFEYSKFNFQAYDIANFFNEHVSDYLCNAHPYFQLDFTRYPSRQDQKLFCAVYLSEYLKTPVRPQDSIMVDPLIDAIEVFSLTSNLVWGVWSVLRSPQAMTFDEFDFMGHGAYRFDAYMRGKRAFLQKKASSGTDQPGMRKSLSALSQMQVDDIAESNCLKNEPTSPVSQPTGTEDKRERRRRRQQEDRRYDDDRFRQQHLKSESEWKWLVLGALGGFVLSVELMRMLRK